jgi:hypothetical protein
LATLSFYVFSLAIYRCELWNLRRRRWCPGPESYALSKSVNIAQWYSLLSHTFLVQR